MGVGVAELAVFVQPRPSPSSAVPLLACCGLWRYRKDQVQSTSLELCASPKEGGTAELNELTGISGRCRILCFVTDEFHFEKVLKFQSFKSSFPAVVLGSFSLLSDLLFLFFYFFSRRVEIYLDIKVHKDVIKILACRNCNPTKAARGC